MVLLQVLNRRASVGLRGRVGAYLASGALLLSFIAALAVLDAERHSPHPVIQTFDDAWWWALTTMTTVGYGDMYPVTTRPRGRNRHEHPPAGAIAAGLMLAGVALLGTVTATLASWLSDGVRADEAVTDAVLVEIQALRRELDALRNESNRRA